MGKKYTNRADDIKEQIHSLENELESVRDEIDWQHSIIDDAESEICSLVERKEEIKESIDSLYAEMDDVNKTAEQKEIDAMACGVKCMFYKDPEKCKKDDTVKKRCPLINSKKLDKWMICREAETNG